MDLPLAQVLGERWVGRPLESELEGKFVSLDASALHFGMTLRCCPGAEAPPTRFVGAIGGVSRSIGVRIGVLAGNVVWVRVAVATYLDKAG